MTFKKLKEHKCKYNLDKDYLVKTKQGTVLIGQYKEATRISPEHFACRDNDKYRHGIVIQLNNIEEAVLVDFQKALDGHKKEQI